MVFQNYALFPHMTVEANLAFPLEVRGMGPEERRQRVRRALRLVQLEGMSDRRPGQLSGGQQQRVAIARALVFEPGLVLMDEPLGALDRSLREEMQYEIRRIHRSLGVTVVYVTHDQQEAMVMSDRIAVLRGGVVEQIAAPEGLYEEPERAFVASFIGENNRLHGRIVSGPAGTCGGGDRRRAPACAQGRAVRGGRRCHPVHPARARCDQPRRGPIPQRTRSAGGGLTFLGDHLRIRLAMCGRDDFIAKIPTSWVMVACWRATRCVSAGRPATAAPSTTKAEKNETCDGSGRSRGHGVWIGRGAPVDHHRVVGRVLRPGGQRGREHSFTEATGIGVEIEDYNGGLAQIRAQVDIGEIHWDVVDLEIADAVRGCDEGLLERIDLASLPPGADGTPAKTTSLTTGAPSAGWGICTGHRVCLQR